MRATYCSARAIVDGHVVLGITCTGLSDRPTERIKRRTVNCATMPFAVRAMTAGLAFPRNAGKMAYIIR
jgi:hypothetical protein